MDFLSDYIKAWERHNIHFGSGLKHLNIIDPPDSALPLIVEDECLVYRYSYSIRNGEKRGCLNERFMDPASLLRVLEGMPEGTIVILPIPEIYGTEDLSFNTFLDKLGSFLAALPSSYRYAVQLQTQSYLLPQYFDCLRKHSVAHVLGEPIFTTDFGVILEVESQVAIIYAVRQAVEEKKALYIYQDLASLRHLMEQLNNDLKRLSALKRTFAA